MCVTCPEMQVVMLCNLTQSAAWTAVQPDPKDCVGCCVRPRARNRSEFAAQDVDGHGQRCRPAVRVLSWTLTMSEGHGWTGDLLDVLTQWGEYCDAASAGRAASRRRSDHGEHLVLFPVWQPESYALAFVDPVTEHVSFLGEGALPKLLELEKMARHAYGAGVGETLFPPLSVRLDGKDTRLRWAGSGSILAFAARGLAPPTRSDPVVVLALLRSGYNLIALRGDRALLIVQGRQRDLDELDLDRLLIWTRLREQVKPLARIEPQRPCAGERPPGRVIDEREHFGALLRVALLALIDDFPSGARGRRDAVSFMDDLARLAALGVPDICGSSKHIAATMARALGHHEPRDSRTTNAVLALLHQHGEQHDEVIVTKESGQRWYLHTESLSQLDSRLFKALLRRRPVLRSILVRDDEPATQEEIVAARLSPARRKVLSFGEQAPLLLGCALSSEWDLRQQREDELRKARANHAAELHTLRATIDALTERLGDANARNDILAAELAKADARLDHLQRHADLLVQQLSAAVAETASLEGPNSSAAVESNKVIVQSFIAAVARRDHVTVAALVSPDFTGHGFALGALRICKRDELINALTRDAEDLPPRGARVESLVAEEDSVAARTVWRVGELKMVQIQIYRLQENQLAEAWGDNVDQDETRVVAANSRPA